MISSQFSKQPVSCQKLLADTDTIKKNYPNIYQKHQKDVDKISVFAMKLSLYCVPDDNNIVPALTPDQVVKLKKEFEEILDAVARLSVDCSNKDELDFAHKMRDYVKNDKEIIDLLNPEDELPLPTAFYKIEKEKERGLYKGKKKELRYPSYDAFYDMIRSDNNNNDLSEDDIFQMYIDADLVETEKNYTEYIKKNPRKYEYAKFGAPSNIPQRIRNTSDVKELEDCIKNGKLTSAEKFRLQMRIDASKKVKEIQAEAKKQMQKGESTSTPVEVKTTQKQNGVTEISVPVKQNRFQTSNYGCWSVSAELLLQSRGIKNVTQENIRSYRPVLDSNTTASNIMDMDYNRNEPKVLMDMGDAIMAYAPNTMLHEVTIEQPGADENKNMDEYVDKTVSYLKKTITHAMLVDHSPVSILIPGHFYTITAIEGDIIKYKNPSGNGDPNQTYESDIKDFINLYYVSGRNPISINWISDIELAKDKHTLYGIPSEHTYLKSDGSINLPPKNIAAAAEGDMSSTNFDGVKISRICGDENNNIGKNIGNLGTVNLYSKEGLKVVEKVYLPKKLDYNYLSQRADLRSMEDEKKLHDADKNFYGLKGDVRGKDDIDVKDSISKNNFEIEKYSKDPKNYKPGANVQNNVFSNVAVENIDEVLNLINEVNKGVPSTSATTDETNRERPVVPPKPPRKKKIVKSEFDLQNSTKGVYSRLLANNRASARERIVVPPRVNNNNNNAGNERPVQQPVQQPVQPVQPVVQPVVNQNPGMNRTVSADVEWNHMGNYASIVDGDKWEKTVLDGYKNQKTNIDKIMYVAKFYGRIKTLSDIKECYRNNEDLYEHFNDDERRAMPFATRREVEDAYNLDSEIYDNMLGDLARNIPATELMTILGMIETNASVEVGKEIKQFKNDNANLTEDQAKMLFSLRHSENKALATSVNDIKFELMLNHQDNLKGLKIPDIDTLKNNSLKQFAIVMGLSDKAIESIQVEFQNKGLEYDENQNAFAAFKEYVFKKERINSEEQKANYMADAQAESNIKLIVECDFVYKDRVESAFMQGKKMVKSTLDEEELAAEKDGIEQVMTPDKFKKPEVVEWSQTKEALDIVKANRTERYTDYLKSSAEFTKNCSTNELNLENADNYRAYFAKADKTKNYENYIKLHSKMNAYTKGEAALRENVAKTAAARMLETLDKPFSVKKIHLLADSIMNMDSFKNLSHDKIMEANFDEEKLNEVMNAAMGEAFRVQPQSKEAYSTAMRTLCQNMMSSEGRSDEYKELVSAVQAIGNLGANGSDEAYINASARLLRAINEYTNDKMSARFQFDGNERFDNALDALAVMTTYTPGVASVGNNLAKRVSDARNAAVNTVDYIRLSDYGVQRAQNAKNERQEIDNGQATKKEIQNRRKVTKAAANNLPLRM